MLGFEIYHNVATAIASIVFFRFAPRVLFLAMGVLISAAVSATFSPPPPLTHTRSPS